MVLSLATLSEVEVVAGLSIALEEALVVRPLCGNEVVASWLRVCLRPRMPAPKAVAVLTRSRAHAGRMPHSVSWALIDVAGPVHALLVVDGLLLANASVRIDGKGLQSCCVPFRASYDS